MNYLEYQSSVKRLNLSSSKFAKILGIARTTPSAVWKKKNLIPIFAERLLEVLAKLPEDERVLFIHHKLKESSEK